MSALIDLAIYAAIAAAVALGAHELWANFTGQYIEEGEHLQLAVDQPKINDLTAQLKQQSDYAASLDQKADNAKINAQAAYDLYVEEHEKNEKLVSEKRAAIPAEVASMRIPESVISLLDGIPATAPVGSGAKVPAGSAGVVAASPATAAADSTLGAVADWGITCRTQYEAARNQVAGWIKYFDSIFP